MFNSRVNSKIGKIRKIHESTSGYLESLGEEDLLKNNMTKTIKNKALSSVMGKHAKTVISTEKLRGARSLPLECTLIDQNGSENYFDSDNGKIFSNKIDWQGRCSSNIQKPNPMYKLATKLANQLVARTLSPTFNVQEYDTINKTSNMEALQRTELHMNNLNETIRWKILNRKTLETITHSTGVSITINKTLAKQFETKPEKKLIFVLEGQTYVAVRRAYLMLHQIASERYDNP